jgi:hypothetical protein
MHWGRKRLRTQGNGRMHWGRKRLRTQDCSSKMKNAPTARSAPRQVGHGTERSPLAARSAHRAKPGPRAAAEGVLSFSLRGAGDPLDWILGAWAAYSHALLMPRSGWAASEGATANDWRDSRDARSRLRALRRPVRPSTENDQYPMGPRSVAEGPSAPLWPSLPDTIWR